MNDHTPRREGAIQTNKALHQKLYGYRLTEQHYINWTTDEIERDNCYMMEKEEEQAAA